MRPCKALPLFLLLASLPHGRGFASWGNPVRVDGRAESSTVATTPGPPWNNGSKVSPFEFLGDPMAPNVVVVAMTAITGHKLSGYGTTPPTRTLLCRLLHSAALNNIQMAIFGYDDYKLPPRRWNKMKERTANAWRKFDLQTALPELLVPFMRTLPQNTLVIAVDAFDVVFQWSARDWAERMRADLHKQRGSIMRSFTGGCWPLPAPCPKYSPSDRRFNVLGANGGLYAGGRDEMIRWCEAMAKRIMHHRKTKVPPRGGDQFIGHELVMRKQWPSGIERIMVDIPQTYMWNYPLHLEEIVYEGARAKPPASPTPAAMVHCSGTSKSYCIQHFQKLYSNITVAQRETIDATNVIIYPARGAKAPFERRTIGNVCRAVHQDVYHAYPPVG